MAKSERQKLKLLYLRDFLYRRTDEEHPATLAEIADFLASNGISAERKSLYDDLEYLRLMGDDIIRTKSVQTRYYIGQRDFELPELKLLVDAVQSSRFLTEKKTMELIHKLEGLTSEHSAQQLHRGVFVCKRVKNMNESIFYNVDKIAEALTKGKKISFKYTRWTIDKKEVYRHGGDYYRVSPLGLIWDDENYYIISFDEVAQMKKTFRVDRMAYISVLSEDASHKKYTSRELNEYRTHTFGMFGGQEEVVRIKCKNALVGAVLDRFGKETVIAPEDDESFTFTPRVTVSPLFFGWICSFCGDMEIVAPEKVRREMKKYLKGLYDGYKG